MFGRSEWNTKKLFQIICEDTTSIHYFQIHTPTMEPVVLLNVEYEGYIIHDTRNISVINNDINMKKHFHPFRSLIIKLENRCDAAPKNYGGRQARKPNARAPRKAAPWHWVQATAGLLEVGIIGNR